MAFKWRPAAWRTDSGTAMHQTRLYIDPRGEEYPPLDGSSVAYTAATALANFNGTYCASLTAAASNKVDYLLDMPSKFTLRVRIKPLFAYATGTYHRVIEWYADANRFFILLFDPAGKRFYVTWKDGGTARSLLGAVIDAGSINQWHIIDLAIDVTTGTTGGSQFWFDRVSADTTWSGNSDVKASSYSALSVGHEGGASSADSLYSEIILIPNYVATDADVQNDFRSVKNEQIVWHFNGEAVGRTRCNVTPYLKSYNTTSGRIDGAARLAATLHNTGGEFSDDQYATFAPENGFYNGLSTQKYLQNRIRCELEDWYGGDYETIFTGRLDENRFGRSSANLLYGEASISAEDVVSDIAREMKTKGRYYEDKKLCDATETDSLVHLIGRLATAKEQYNYIGNSGFENATIGNSWLLFGAGATLARSNAQKLFGSYSGLLTNGAGGSCVAYQFITFLGSKKINLGESWTFSVYLYSSANVSGQIQLNERAGAVDGAGSSTNYSLTAGSWSRVYVTKTIVSAATDRLVAVIRLDTLSQAVYCDAAMLVYGSRPVNWYVNNATDGASGVISADSAASLTYDSVGYDCEPVNIVHPWARVEANTSVWSYLQQIRVATAARMLRATQDGVIKFRSPLGSYGDPAQIGTLTESSVQAPATTIDTESANRIVGHGTRIIKNSSTQTWWQASASGDFDGNDKDINETVLNGGQWPSPLTFGAYWAKLGET
jgi:hypothetical protein